MKKISLNNKTIEFKDMKKNDYKLIRIAEEMIFINIYH